MYNNYAVCNDSGYLVKIKRLQLVPSTRLEPRIRS